MQSFRYRATFVDTNKKGNLYRNPQTSPTLNPKPKTSKS